MMKLDPASRSIATFSHAEHLVAGIGALVALGISLVCLTGEYLGDPRFIFPDGLGCMAPSSALCLILLASAFLLQHSAKNFKFTKVIICSVSALTSACALALFAQSLSDPAAIWDWEANLTSEAARNQGMLPMHMASATSLLITLAAVGLLSSSRRLTLNIGYRITGILACLLVALLCVVVVISHAIGIIPSLASRLRPTSLLTALALFPLSISMALSLEFWSYGLCFLLGHDKATLQQPENRRKRQLATLGLLALFALILAFGTFYIRAQFKLTKAAVTADLSSITELKAQEISIWLKERLGDARVLMHQPYLAAPLKRICESETDKGDRAPLLAFFNAFRSNYGYRSITLYDSEGRLLLSAPQTDGQSPELPRNILQDALHKNDVTWLDTGTMEEKVPGIHLLTSINTSPETGRTVLIDLCIDPATHLYPILQKWPSAASSGENNLLRLQGTSIHCLNNPKTLDLPARGIRQALKNKNLLIPKAFSEPEKQLLRGLNSHGVPMLGMAKRIPDTPWVLLSKMPVQDAFERMRGEVFQSTLGAVITISVSSLILGAAWRNRHQKLLENQLEAERSSLNMSKRLALLMKRANDVFILIDETMRIVEVNERAEACYGYTKEELLRMHIQELRAKSCREFVAKDFAKAFAPTGMIFETLHQRRDGTEFPVEVSSGMVEIDGKRHILSIIRDITERRAQEIEIRRLSRMFKVISEVNQAIIHVESRPQLFEHICRILNETGHFNLAWIGWLDTDSQIVKPVAVAGVDHDYIKDLRISIDPSLPEAHGPSGTAFRESRTQVCNDFFKDPSTLPWKDRAKPYGFHSSIALPLLQEGKTLGLLTLYSSETDFFGVHEISLLEEAAGDVSFALSVLEKDERRHAAEVALHASQARLNFLLSSTPAAIYSLSCSGEFATTYLSDNVEALLGYKAEDFMSEPNFWLSHVHPEDLPKTFDSYKELAENDRATREYRFLHRDGSYRWMQDDMRLIRDGNGQPVEYVGYWIDVSTRKEAELALAIREEIFSSIVGQALDAVVLIDATTGHFVEFNTAAHEGLGYKREEFNQFTIFDIQANPSSTEVQTNIEKILSTGNASFETTHQHRDGRIRDVRIKARYIKVRGHDYITGMWSDITERKQLDLELHELVKQLRALNTISAALDQQAMPLEDLLALIARQLPSVLRAPSLAKAIIEVDGCRQEAGAQGELIDKITSAITINGHVAGLITVGYVQPRQSIGKDPFFVPERETVASVAKNIGIGLGAKEALAAVQKFNAELESKVEHRTAELAQRNREVQALLNAVPDLVMRLQMDGTILNLQPAHDSALLSSIQFSAGEKGQQGLKDLLPACTELGRQALSEVDTVTREIELSYAGNSLVIELRAAPVGTDEFVVFARDITARKHLEIETSAMLEKERQVSEMKTRFISVTSHEFRTPMAVTMSAVELIHNHADQLTQAKREELFGRVNNSLQRMTQMLDEILTLSRIDAGKMKLQTSTINLQSLIQELVEDIKMEDKESHRIQFTASGEFSQVNTDPNILHHIISNLLSNATRYSPPESMVSISLEVDEHYITISVEDEGIGIPPEDRRRIFEPFERGSNASTIKGTGLGLNIVQRMTDMLGGRIAVKSQPGKGSQFTVVFPQLNGD